MPEYVAERGRDNLILRNYENRLFSYPDPSMPKCLI